MKIGAAINYVKLGIEDPSMTPQHAIAFPNEMVYDSIIMAKDTVLYSDKSKTNNHGESYMITCVPMEKVDISDCPSSPPTGCYWMKTKVPLPLFNGDILYSVTSNNIINQVYDYIDLKDIRGLSTSRFKSISSQNKYTFINKDGKKDLYLIGKPIRNISVYGPFNNPIEVILYPKCGKNLDKICNILDVNFDVPGEYLMSILDMAKDILANNWKRAGNSDSKTDDIDFSKIKNQ